MRCYFDFFFKNFFSFFKKLFSFISSTIRSIMVKLSILLRLMGFNIFLNYIFFNLIFSMILKLYNFFLFFLKLLPTYIYKNFIKIFLYKYINIIITLVKIKLPNVWYFFKYRFGIFYSYFLSKSNFFVYLLYRFYIYL